MKTYQDTETGKLHAFEDGIDPFSLNNRNIPTTLSETIIPQPDSSYVWFGGDWVKNTEVPTGYKPPTSSVPSYNPAWMAFLNPYTAVLHNAESKLDISLDQINANSYDGNKLSEAVATLPLNSAEHIHALISYDGAIAIPMNADYPTGEKALEGINRMMCAILLGGIHAEVISPEGLVCGSLHNESCLFSYTPSLHTRLQHNAASMQERLIPLMHPRVLYVSDLREAYFHGLSVIDAISNFSPFFLLHGYSAMVYQNRSDALNSLWIAIEQITCNLWENDFLSALTSQPPHVRDRFAELKREKKLDRISAKHELLNLSKVITDDCFAALSSARKIRNELVHEGLVPDFCIIENLWKHISELLELASKISSVWMGRLTALEAPEREIPEKYNFDEWAALIEKLVTD